MNHFQIQLKARGQLLKLIAYSLTSIAALFLYFSLPEVIEHEFLPGIQKISFNTPSAFILGLALGAAVMALYTIALARTTKIAASRINISMTRGIFIRRTDALDLTGILDCAIERTILDMMLKISHIKVISRDKTHPTLILEGVEREDAKRLYDHIIAYSNKSMVEYVQGHQDRLKYNKKHSQKPDPKWTREIIDDGGSGDAD